MDRRAQLIAAAVAGPDPEGAPTRIARFCDAAGDALAEVVIDDDAAGLLLAVASQSPYLMQPLVREPARLVALARDPYLRREKDAATMRAELAALLDEETDLAAGLRRYRNAEYLRLGARELGWGPQEEVARELAHLADVTLDAARRALARRARRQGRRAAHRRRAPLPLRRLRHGQARRRGAQLLVGHRPRLLLRDRRRARRRRAHAARVLRAPVRAADAPPSPTSPTTGYVFRVDLRLRPEGTRGPVCNSLGAAERYYETFGRTWERQAWLKRARRRRRPRARRGGCWRCWRRSSGRARRAPRSSRARARARWRACARERRASRSATSSSGRAASARSSSSCRRCSWCTAGAIRRCASAAPCARSTGCAPPGIVSEREHRALADAYVFLRRVEHRLQLAEGRQTHALPADADGEALLAQTARIRRSRRFSAALRVTRRSVSAIFATLGAPESPPSPAIVRAARSVAGARGARRRARHARLPQRGGVDRRDGAVARQAAVALRAGDGGEWRACCSKRRRPRPTPTWRCVA